MYEVNINAHPDRFLDWDKPLSQQPINAALDPIRESAAKSFPNIRDNPDITGHGLYQAYAQHRGNNFDAASEGFKQAGAAGIKYLDQGSRAAGDGSRNYVVFDPSIIEIMRKYGLLGPAAGGALYDMMGANQAQAAQ